MKKIIYSAFILAAGVCSCIQLRAQGSTQSADQALARSILKELIEINTTYANGNTTIAAEAMAKRLKDAGFADKDIEIIGPEARNKNLIVRIHGAGKSKPVLYLAHLDVVEAKRDDWSLDPFMLTEKEGWFYGRGTIDIKGGAAILVTNFIRLKKEGFVPGGDLILALTAGEEGNGSYDGVEWLLENKRSLIEAGFCVNVDAGGPMEVNGKVNSFALSASEKGFLTLHLEVKNPGGHSSLPTKDNAIYRLADGLLKISRYEFPVQLNEITRGYFSKMAWQQTGQIALDMKAVAGANPDAAAAVRLSASPYYNALLRTTCIATEVTAGHAENALPQSAKASVNCRILPGIPQADVIDTLTKIIADTQVVITISTPQKNNPPSLLTPWLEQTVEKLTTKFWPGVSVLPFMETGATDGIYLRAAGIPSYGISPIAYDVNDYRAHGKDERIGVKAYYEGVEYAYQLIKSLAL